MDNSNISEIHFNDNSMRMLPVSPSASQPNSFLGLSNIKNQDVLIQELEKSLNNYKSAQQQIQKY